MLYVEGPRDREILESWARRVEPSLTRCIGLQTVILGGRQPARALRDFRKRGGADAGWVGLIVLDRDDHPEGDLDGAVSELGEEPGLELFVWGLRHIESYLLVPAAIGRVLDLPADDDRVDRALALERGASAPESDAGSAPHAKRLLGAGGSLSESLGRALPAGEIARAMRADEIHADVHALLARIGRMSGLVASTPEVVIRRS